MDASKAIKRVIGFLAVLASFVLCMICYFAGATSLFVPQADFFHIGPPHMLDTFVVSPGANLVHPRDVPDHFNISSTSDMTVYASESVPGTDDRFFYIYLWKNCYSDVRTAVANCSQFSPRWDYNLMQSVASIMPPQLNLESETMGVENTLTARFVYVTYTCALALTGMAVLLQAIYSFTDGLLLIFLADVVFAFLFLFAANCGYTFVMNNGVSTINRLTQEHNFGLQARHGKLWLTLTWVSDAILLLCVIAVMVKKPWKEEEEQPPPTAFLLPSQPPPPPSMP